MSLSTDFKNALTIATSDSSNGAGIGADLKAFMARGVNGLSVHCCLTAQNPDGVSGILELEQDFILNQLKQLDEFYALHAAKTGMLFSEAVIETIVEFLRVRKEPLPLVVDPVMVASSGAVLLRKEAIDCLRTKLLPLATLITPNLDEAAVLLGERPQSLAEMRTAAEKLARMTGTAVLMKGGHLEGDTLVDILFEPDAQPQEFSTRRSTSVDTHGSGCTLSAAIAAELAKGESLADAVAYAHAYLQGALRAPMSIAGRSFIRHDS